MIIARLPVDIPTNQLYQVRISVAGSPMISAVSPTKVSIKTGPKPIVPTCDSIQYGCQFAEPTQPSTITSSLSVRGLISNSEIYLYDDNGLNTRWTPSRYIDNMGNKSPYASFSAENVNGNPYTKNFYFTQSVDGCESDKVPTKLKILPINRNGVKLIIGTYVQYDSNFYGSKLSVCQYDKLDSISTYYVALPAGFVVSHSRITGGLYAGGKSVLGSYVPPTDSLGETYYGFRSYAIEPMTYCNPQRYSGPFLKIIVNPNPQKPQVLTPAITYFQTQTAVALSATASNTATTLRWYGPDATGSQSTTIASVPATDKPGTFTYAVSSVLNGCESERVPMIVTVLAPLAVEDPALADLITVYPVPTAAFITVTIDAALLKAAPAALQLTDATGRVLWQHETRESKTPVSLQNVGTGVYFLRVKIGEKQAVRRVMKL